MSELWIRFADPDFAAFDWWRFDGDAENPVSEGHGQGEDLARLERASLCRVFLPQSRLLSLRAKLPPRASRQQLQAIGYALEDQLANDVDDNHYAIGAQQPDGQLPVVVIERSLMDRLLQRLREARMQCDALHAEMLLCPVPPADCRATLCERPGGWLLRLSEDEALALPPELLDDSLKLLLGAGSDAAGLACCASTDPSVPDELQKECKTLDCRPRRDLLSDRAVNLLQGDYRPGSRWRERVRAWRPALALLLLLIFVSLSLAGLDWLNQKRQLAEIEQQQWALIDRYLPGAAHRGDPKRLLVQRLADFQKGARGNELVDLLSQFAEAWSAHSGVDLDRLVYRDGELVLDLETPKLRTLEQLQETLKNQDRNFRIENLDIGPSKTRARLILGGTS